MDARAKYVMSRMSGQSWGSAIVLANGVYRIRDGKVAHGLVRGSTRFRVAGVVEPELAGRDAGEVLDGVHRGIPILASVADALAVAGGPPQFCLIGVAPHGGHLNDELRGMVLEAIEGGLSIVNGLHDWVSADPLLARAAERRGVRLIDVRKPKSLPELRFWSGAIYEVKAPRIAMLGMDCAIGKRTTARLLVEALETAGLRAEMIYTGQTGWMQGADYGLVLDSLPNDFVCGELEHAIVSCDREVEPDVMVIEGQAGLRVPCGPCGAELLLSGAASGVVLQHAPGRVFFDEYEHLELRIPEVEEEVRLIACYGVPTLGIALNGEGSTEEGLKQAQSELRERLGVPVVRPLEEGVGELIAVIRRLIEEQRR
jgi:uncharacterized NAD-dependent epimerase/dehydratase family protein